MNKLATRIKNVGPGALVAAAFIGPGTVTSCSISGATAGYTLLWAMLLSVISVIIMQSMAARLGIVSGMGLGEALREKFTSQGARILISILVIAAVFIGNIAYETGNLTGSILGIQAAFPAADNQTAKIVLALVLGVIAFALLFSGSYQRVENILTALVVLMGIIFLICAFAAGPDWGAVFAGLFGFKVPDGGDWMTVAALMGTTVVPYNIYLHAASASTKWGKTGDKEDALANSRFDSIISIGLGGIISMAIIVCAAATIHAAGGSISSGADMAKALTPLLGSWATVIFGIGLFAAGITSTLTLGYRDLRYRPLRGRYHKYPDSSSCSGIRELRNSGLGRRHEAGKIQSILDHRSCVRYFRDLHTGCEPDTDHSVRAGC